jgi:putative ABC transport system permease protein
MSAIRQFARVTAMNLRSVAQRPATASVIVVGIMGVVLVLISMLALGVSLAESVRSTGKADRAIVLRAGTDEEVGSSLFVDEVRTILSAPGIAESAAGDPIATVDMVTAVQLRKKNSEQRAAIVVRGMSEHGAAVRPEINVTEGRWFRPGLNELIVGRSAYAQFQGLDIGDKVRLRRGEWTVVGSFESGNGLQGSLLTDTTTLMSAYVRTQFTSVTVLLRSAEEFESFKAALTSNPALSVDPVREIDYYGRMATDIAAAIYLVSFIIGGIMGVGALFGALNTMYTTVSNRGIEIATLRAMGFGGGPVVAAVLSEAMLLALVGGLMGAALAWLFLSGNTFGLGTDEGSIVAQLRVTPLVVAIGLAWACVVGLLGGLFPAVRAARMPVAAALKAE